MTSFERIVRPFQTGDVFDARVLPPEQPPLGDPPPNIVLSWEGAAPTNYIEEPPPVTMGFTIEWQEDKGRRVTATERVENPDDASQFVEVEKVMQATFKNAGSGEEMTLKFASD